jgi:hypothetical protein
MENTASFKREDFPSVKAGTWELLAFPGKGDHRGELFAIEGSKNIPFDIKRVYYLVETKLGVVRGLHAHKNLDQVLIAISGSCRVLVDDGRTKEYFALTGPGKGLRIKNLVWREMDQFTPDCVLLVLASDIYKESDYIRDYSEFLKVVNSKQGE